MKFSEVDKILQDVWGMPTKKGLIVHNFIKNNNIHNILELGFAHGRSTCYMAAALDEVGTGSITTIDFDSARERNPNIMELSSKTKLGEYIKPVFADRSFTWELMKLIEKQTRKNVCEPLFDFCYLDAGHNWDTTGFGFFLVEKLLKRGGWLLFDDLGWTYDNSPSLKDKEYVKKMPEDYKTTPQVGKVFSLLVRQHPGFKNIKQEEKWGWAQKNRTHIETIFKSIMRST